MKEPTIIFVYLFALLFITGCRQTDEHADASKDKLSVLTEKIKKDSSNTKLYFERARLYTDKSMFDLAYADMARVMNLDSMNAEYLMLYSDLSFRMNKVRASRDALLHVRALNPANLDAAFKLAELYLYSNNQDLSLKYIDSVLQKDPKNTKALLMKSFNLKEKGDTANAIATLRFAIDIDPKFYEAQIQLGLLSYIKKDKLTVEYYKNALAIKPESEEARYGLAMWYQEHEDYNAAISYYTDIIQVNPKNKNAYFNLGYLHQINLKVYSEAIKYYTKAIESDPQYAQAFYNRGLCYEFVGNIAAAKDDFTKALDIRKQNYPPAQEGLERVSK